MIARMMLKKEMPRYVHCTSIKLAALAGNKTFFARIGETMVPTACMACDRVNRVSAYSGGPQRAMKGFAASSNVDSPAPVIKFEIRNAGKELSTAEGQKTRHPQA